MLQGGDQVQIDAVLRSFEVSPTLITTTPTPCHYDLFQTDQSSADSDLCQSAAFSGFLPSVRAGELRQACL